MDAIHDLEIAVVHFIQSLGPWMMAPMRFFTFLGEEEFFVLVMPVLFWCVSPGLGLRVGMLLMISNSVNAYLKMLFHTARPYWLTSQIRGWVTETSFGFPSNHAQSAACIWGFMAASLRRRWIWGIGLILIVLIGLSRIYLGVHFLSDVLGGWIIGALLAWIFYRVEITLRPWMERRSLTELVGLAFAVSALFLALSALVLAVTASVEIPAFWLENARFSNPEQVMDPFSLTGMVTSAGTWFGLAAGAAWLWRSGGFDPRGSGLQYLGRYLLGIAGVALLWYGLGQVFPRTEDWLGYGLRFLRYGLVGLWVSALAPALFFRFGLARRKGKELTVYSGQLTEKKSCE